MRTPRPSARERGFTLVEMLVVIGVIAVLVAISVPALRGAKTAAMSVACQSNLRSLYTATLGYVHEHERMLPWAEVIVYYPIGDEVPLPAHAAYLDAPLPRLDESGVVVTGQPWLCPEDREWGMVSGTSYDYVPALLIGILGHREATRLFEDSPTTPLWTDHLVYHAGDWQNFVRYDGALDKSHVGEGF